MEVALHLVAAMLPLGQVGQDGFTPFLPFNLLIPRSSFDQPVSRAYGEIDHEDIRQCTPYRAKERDEYGRQG